MYLRAFVFLLLNKTNSKIHDMMDIKTANEIRVVDNFVFKMKLINQSNYSTPRSFEAPWIIFSKTLISLFKKTSGHNYDIFDVTTHICVFFDVATRNCTVFVRNYRSQCDRSYGVTTPQSYRNGGHGNKHTVHKFNNLHSPIMRFSVIVFVLMVMLLSIIRSSSSARIEIFSRSKFRGLRLVGKHA